MTAMKTVSRVLAFLAAATLSGVCAYLYRGNLISQEERYAFSCDVIRYLKVCLEADECAPDDRFAQLEAYHRNQRKLLDARKTFIGWKCNRNDQIKECSAKWVQGLSRLLDAQDVELRLQQGSSSDPVADLAKFGEALDSGREKILDGSVGLAEVISSFRRHQVDEVPIELNLSRKQVEKLDDYLNQMFATELKEAERKSAEKKAGRCKTYDLPTEVWAIIYIRNLVEKCKTGVEI